MITLALFFTLKENHIKNWHYRENISTISKAKTRSLHFPDSSTNPHASSRYLQLFTEEEKFTCVSKLQRCERFRLRDSSKKSLSTASIISRRRLMVYDRIPSVAFCFHKSKSLSVCSITSNHITYASSFFSRTLTLHTRTKTTHTHQANVKSLHFEGDSRRLYYWWVICGFVSSSLRAWCLLHGRNNQTLTLSSNKL